MKILRLPLRALCMSAVLLSLPVTAAADAFFAGIRTSSGLTTHHLCDYKLLSICTIHAAGSVWHLVNEDDHVYIFNHQKHNSVKYVDSKSLLSLRSGETVFVESASFTVTLVPMRAMRQ